MRREKCVIIGPWIFNQRRSRMIYFVLQSTANTRSRQTLKHFVDCTFEKTHFPATHDTQRRQLFSCLRFRVSSSEMKKHCWNLEMKTNKQSVLSPDNESFHELIRRKYFTFSWSLQAKNLKARLLKLFSFVNKIFYMLNSVVSNL